MLHKQPSRDIALEYLDGIRETALRLTICKNMDVIWHDLHRQDLNIQILHSANNMLFYLLNERACKYILPMFCAPNKVTMQTVIIAATMCNREIILV